MVSINTLAGQTESDASAVAMDVLEGVTEAVVYPAQDIESRPEDVEDLWHALNALKD
jgi:hypothetical protein